MRISTNMPNNDQRYTMVRRDEEIRDIQNSIANSSRLNRLRDDPSDAAAVSRIGSQLERYQQYDKNIKELQHRLDMSDGAIQQGTELIQQIRELTVRGSNGLFSKADMGYMALEVDQLLREMVQVANSRDAQNKALFAGTKTSGTAYSTLDGRVEGMQGSVITQVSYQGNQNEKRIAVGDENYLSASRPGNHVFWADNNGLYGQTDSQNYVATQDSYFKVDDKRIEIATGDNIYAIISKINDADVSVKARLDPRTNGLVLNATEPHQIWLDEPVEATTLKDLGMIRPTGIRPPNNLSNDVIVTGGNLFDAIIDIRDSLAKGDHETLGSRGLRGMDAALGNLLNSSASIGSTLERTQSLESRYTSQIITASSWKSEKNDLNMAEAITNMKELEAVQQAAYQVAGKILQTTLMDYLR